jgi:hypothetical protein
VSRDVRGLGLFDDDLPEGGTVGVGEGDVRGDGAVVERRRTGVRPVHELIAHDELSGLHVRLE